MYTKQGFTLIELLVVVSLFAIVAIGGSGMFIALVRNNQKSEQLLSIKREGDTAITTIKREVTWAKDIIVPIDPLECDGNSLKTGSSVGVEIINVDDKEVKIYCNDNSDGTKSDDKVVLSVEDKTDVTLISYDDSNTEIVDCSISCESNLGRYNLQFSYTLTTVSGETQGFSLNQTLRNSQP